MVYVRKDNLKLSFGVSNLSECHTKHPVESMSSVEGVYYYTDSNTTSARYLNVQQ